ncbi:PLRKT protein, partial [Certhia brachydactyla]|nr:PLRKT protein [Certhia brachydactyla]
LESQVQPKLTALMCTEYPKKLFFSLHRAIKRKNPAVLLPILPLSFVFCYHYDMGYGTLLQRIKEAENILDTLTTLLELPKGPLTFEDLERIRISQSNFFIEK